MKRSDGKPLPAVTKSHPLLPQSSSSLAVYPRLGEAAWRIGRYRTNSGLSNAPYNKRKPKGRDNTSLLLGNRANIYDSLRPLPNTKQFYSNIGTEAEVELSHTSTSFINYQSTDYDPITNVVMRPVGPRTTKAVKGIGFARHKHMLSLGTNQNFVETFERNPKVFFRRSGEFSKYKELLVKSQGGKRG